MADEVRVRFAPSPTGPLHIGGLRSALYNFLFARKNKGKFILRIEDTDRNRYISGAEEYIINSLKWCGLQVDESPETGGPFGPYRQSERKEIYRQYAMQLIREDKAYYAFDTPDSIEAMRTRLKAEGASQLHYNAFSRGGMKNSLTMNAREVDRLIEDGTPYIIRIKLPGEGVVSFKDQIRGNITFDFEQLDDKVLLKADGMPTYHLANVVDDHLMKITHVIRGEEWLPSTPLHVMLYRYFGWEDEIPQFAHLPLLLKPNGKGKLSKRDGDRMGFPVFPLEWKDPASGEISPGYRESGFLPEAFVNFLALLGWNPGTAQEIFSINQLIQQFSLDRVNRSGAKFDFEKAKWFNKQYISSLSLKELVSLVRPILQSHGVNPSDSKLEKFCDVFKERAVLLTDFWEQGCYIFQKPDNYDRKAFKKRWKNNSAEIFNELLIMLDKMENFSSEDLERAVHDFIEKRSLAYGQVLPLMRLMLTGSMKGPSLFDIAAMLGKQETLTRLKDGLKYFAEINYGQ